MNRPVVSSPRVNRSANSPVSPRVSPRVNPRVNPRVLAVRLVLLAGAGTLALTMGVRQTMGLFLGSLNTATGVGLANISLAFAFGQLWWGPTQPFAGALADKLGAGRVLFCGVALVASGTFITPWMTSTAGLIFAIFAIFALGVLAAGGAGMAGPAVLMATTTRLIAPEKRGMALGIVNAVARWPCWSFCRCRSPALWC